MYLSRCSRENRVRGCTPVRVRVFVVILLLRSLSFATETKSRTSLSRVRPGDLNIGYLISIHEMSPKTRKCDILRMNELICFEAFAMAVEQITRRTDLLPNISFGFVAMDDCFNDIIALEMAVDMMNSVAVLHRRTSDASHSCESAEINHDVLGVVGLSTSRVAVMVAPYFGVFQIPTLSLYATSDELSDKSRYEYFSRLTPPDRFHEETLLQVAKKMGWNFLSLVYSEGAYGENAVIQINRLLRSKFYDICLAVSVKIPSDAKDEDFDKVVRQLTSNSHARVALTFIGAEHLRGFFEAVRLRVRAEQRILWLGGDELSELQNEPYADVIEGGIYTDAPSSEVPELKQHVSTLRPWLEPRDSWFSLMWEQIFQCRLENGTDDRSSGDNVSICYRNQSFPTDFPGIDWRWPMTARAYDSAYVYASALDSLIRKECPEAFTDKSRLRNCISGQRLLQYVRNVSFEGVTGKIRFDSDGNLIGDLLIRQYQKTSIGCCSNYAPVTAGIWNSSNNAIHLDMDKVKWTRFSVDSTENGSGVLESVCSKPCQRNEYAVHQDIKCCWFCMKCRSNEIVNKNRTSCEPCPQFYWPDEDTSTTCIFIRPSFLQTNHPLSLSLLCLAFAGCSISLAVFVVYFLRRKHRLIKATSIELSLIILTGTMMASVTVIFFVLPPREEMCMASNIGFHSAINMLYGPLLVKNIRTYRIFKSAERSITMPRGVGTSSQLTFTLLITVIQVILLTISELFDRSTVALNMPTTYEKYIEIYCHKSALMFLLPLSYNIALMAVCTMLGFITRKLPENFNESAYIFVSVSTTLFAWIVFVPAYFAQSNFYLRPAILGFCLVLNVFVTLACLFLRVVYAVYFISPKTTNLNSAGSKIDPVVAKE